MGFMDMVKGQFLDVIEYVDDNSRQLVYKYIRPGDEIKQGSQVIVRESQAAVFLKGGQLADILPPGTYTLNTENMPILSTLNAFSFGFNSPVKADLYFINMRQFMDNRWGTKNPVIMRDKEFKMARIRAFGKFAFRVINVEVFMREVFGNQRRMRTDDVVEYLVGVINQSFAQVVGSCGMPVLDLAVRYHELAGALQAKSNEEIVPLGIEFSRVLIENISLPEEVEEMIDEQSGIGMAKDDMGTFMQYQTARAMRDSAGQDNGMAGMGAGMAMGNIMASVMQSAVPKPKAEPEREKDDDIDDAVEQLRKLKSLVDDGILTQEEFDVKKKQILGL